MSDVYKAHIQDGTIVQRIVATAQLAGQVYKEKAKALWPLTTTGDVTDKTRGIYGSTVAQHFEVHMRPGRPTAAAHFSNYVAFFNNFPNLDQQLFVMPIAGTDAIAMINFN